MNSHDGMNSKGTGLICVGIFLVSIVFLMFEIVLTKVFSIMYFYHFAFLVVSLALIGIGVSSLLVYLLPSVFSKEKFPAQITLFCSLLAVSIPLTTYFLLTPNPIHALWSTGLAPLAFSAIATIPFLLGGFITALILFHRSESFSKLYFANLTGAGIGCGLVVFVLDTFGGLIAIFIISTLVAVAAVLFALVKKDRKSVVAALILVLGLAILIPVNQRFKVLKIRSYKLGARRSSTVQYEKWTSLFHTTLSADEFPMENFLIFNDGVGGGPVFRFDGEFDKVEFLKSSVRDLAFHLREYERSLILGSGGGESILTALLFGNKDLTGVEINPVSVEIVRDRLGEYSGGIYSRPEVNIVIDEARSFVHRSEDKYDVIHLSLVDSFAATLAGAFAFTENNLYSVEAFVDYVEHLTDEGVLSVTRLLWASDLEEKRYFEAMRVLSMAAEALEREGIENLRPHVIIAGGSFFPFQPQSSGIGEDRLFTLLLKKTPFRDDEIEKVRRVSDEWGFHVIATPSEPWHPGIRGFFEGGGRQQHMRRIRATTGLDIYPATDDRPFFFNLVRPMDSLRQALGGERIVDRTTLNLGYLLLGIASVFVLLFVLPFIVGGRWVSSTRVKATILSYFACLGVGFMLVEITLMQKFTLFLGHPTYSLSVVLFSLLVFSGVGSYLVGHVPEQRVGSYLPRILLVLALGLLVSIGIFPKILAWFFDASLWIRVLVTVVMISPLAVLMGMPFPTAIRMHDRTEHEMIPWVWSVNGIATVLGSVGAVFLSIGSGFTVTLLTGVGAYLLAFVTTFGMRAEERA